ncbi:hypothetical protein [Thiohalocapsa sp.]|uniref:hypothetical protein n=1 Tax=Thiohalocapsa sp. TaxID=2497641 RepID=UPI0025D2C13A|nr:hypothetical protein [Thiohalocapsa sp.]
MENKTFFRVVFALVVIVTMGVVAHSVTKRLSDQALYLALGGGGVLAIVVSIGTLFIVKDAVQAYITRRLLADDDYRDLKQLAMVSRLMGKSGNVNLKLPQREQAPWAVLPQSGENGPGQRPAFDGEFRDTTGVELE